MIGPHRLKRSLAAGGRSRAIAWRMSCAGLGDGAIDENYHAFLHLLDHTEAPLLQGDQLPGPVSPRPGESRSGRAGTRTVYRAR